MEVERFYDDDADAKIGIERGESRYLYDGILCPKGWRQYDTQQDAWYFGIWVNMAERSVFTYAEGDRTFEIASDDEAFKAKLASMAEFYGPPPPAFIVLDADGSRTDVYDIRPGEEDPNNG